MKTWLSTRELMPVIEVLQGLVDTYRQDFEKYAGKKQVKYVNLVYSNISRSVGRKLIFAKLSSEHKSRELSPALDLLCKAQIIHKVTHTSCGGLPLAADANPNFFKAIMSDVGLMQTMLSFDPAAWILKTQETLTHKGAVIENFIGQEILAYSSPLKQGELYYWAREKRGASAEVDYVLGERGSIVPIEVKAGKSSKSKSMGVFFKVKPGIIRGIHFSTQNFQKKNNIHYYPLYAASLAVKLETVSTTLG
jgi:hypothetical protein